MATQLKKVVAPSGGDYTTLEACMHANEQNLVAADKYFDVEISGNWSGAADTTYCTIHNYTTDATRYINIYATGTALHAGVYNEGGSAPTYYRLRGTASGTQLAISCSNITITGFIVEDYGTNAADSIFTVDGTNVILNEVIICKTTGDLAYGRCLYLSSSSGDKYITINNCIMRNATYAIYDDSSSGYYLTANNCLIYGSTNGWYNNAGGNPSRAIFKNCVARGVTNGWSGNYDATNSDYNSSSVDNDAPVVSPRDDSTSPWYSGATADASIFTDVSVKNFKLVTSCIFIDVGVTVAAASPDIKAYTRTGTWDIGPNEYEAAGGGTTTYQTLALCGVGPVTR